MTFVTPYDIFRIPQFLELLSVSEYMPLVSPEYSIEMSALVLAVGLIQTWLTYKRGAKYMLAMVIGCYSTSNSPFPFISMRLNALIGSICTWYRPTNRPAFSATGDRTVYRRISIRRAFGEWRVRLDHGDYQQSHYSRAHLLRRHTSC